jgi:hypothetical protein
MKTKILLNLAALGLVMASCSKKKDEPAPTPTINLTVTQLKAKYTDSAVTIGANTHVSGIVISDTTGKNVEANTIIIQEAIGKRGIVVHFAAAPAFALNDQVDIDISNQSLQSVNGEVSLSNIPVANARKTGTGAITPAKLKISALGANAATLDGTLVWIGPGTFSGGNGNYSGALTYEDSATTATLTSNVQTGAAFAGQAYPVLIDSLIGIVRISGTTVSVDIRNAADVQNAINYTLTEDFQELSTPGAYENENGYNQPLPTMAWGTGYDFGEINIAANSAGGPDAFSNKKYIFSLPRAQYSYITPPRLAGVKLVTITFAGDLSQTFLDMSGKSASVTPFDASQDSLQVALYVVDDDGIGALIKIKSFKDFGVFHTDTIKIPDRLVGIYEGYLNTRDPLYFYIYNYSNLKKGQSGDTFRPIIIDHVDFSYAKKP